MAEGSPWTPERSKAAGSRWSLQRKYELVDDVVRGRRDRATVIAEYGLSEEEFAGWERGHARWGLRGLQVGRGR